MERSKEIQDMQSRIVAFRDNAQKKIATKKIDGKPLKKVKSFNQK
jgi:hypothetical protein